MRLSGKLPWRWAVWAASLALVLGGTRPLIAQVRMFKTGVVASRGLVLGPNGKPIFAEFAADSSVVTIIGEATGALEGAYVASADSYRQYVAVYKAFMAENGTGIAQGAYILTRQAYEQTTFYTASGVSMGKPPPPTAPGATLVNVGGSTGVLKALHHTTKTVLVRHKSKILHEAVQPVLLESGIDLLNIKTLAPDTRALLLTKDGQVIREAKVNIGYRVAFFSGTDPNAPMGATPVYVTDPSSDQRILRQAGDKVWAPMTNVGIEVSIDLHAKSVSGNDGRYSIPYNLPSCPGFTYEWAHDVIGRVMYRNFNPKSNRVGLYFTALKVFDQCSQLSVTDSWNPFKQMAAIEVAGIEATSTIPMIRADLRIDVNMITGEGVMLKASGEVPLAAETKYEPVFAPTPPQQPSQIINGRWPDAPTDLSSKGLLTHISTDDLKKTDIYVFRESSGQLITERLGLRAGEYIPYNDIGTATNSFFYKMLIRGTRANDLLTGQLESYQAKTQLNPALVGQRVDFLRAGEWVKVVAINRPTGYIATARGQVGGGFGEGRIDFPINKLFLRPPNLKIKAERLFQVEGGLTDGKRRRNIIGFEGAAMASDKAIVISTQWLDHDGSPLPKGIDGYTGRLAKIVLPNELGTVGGVAQFDIKPGTHLQLVQLAEAEIATDHYYVHVSGSPKDRNPDFSVHGPNGVGQMVTRPRYYVPIKVPVFVEKASTLLADIRLATLKKQWTVCSPTCPDNHLCEGGQCFRQCASSADCASGITCGRGLCGGGKPAPALDAVEKVYEWPHRPEMQFSIYDLDIATISTEQVMGDTYAEMTTVDYGITEDELGALGNLGPLDQMILALGFEEAAANIATDSTETFTSAVRTAQSINALTPQDYLALQLYASTDTANGLYEYLGLPVLIMAVPKRGMRLQRTFSEGGWNAAQSNAGLYDITDGYSTLEFFLPEAAEVRVDVYDRNRLERGALVPPTTLPASKTPSGDYQPHKFLVTYDDIAGLLIDHTELTDFWLKIYAKPAPSSISAGMIPREHTIWYQGDLAIRHKSLVLGRIVQHDVAINNGALGLEREDIADMPGLGPELKFVRTFSSIDERDNGWMGYGWVHNLNVALVPNGWGNVVPTLNNIPEWVPPLQGRFFRQSDIPNEDPPLTRVEAAGVAFKKFNGVWFPQRGKNGRLEFRPADADFPAGSIDYVDKKGTRYRFDPPVRLKSDALAGQPASTALPDPFATRLGVNRQLLELHKGYFVPGAKDIAQPTPLKILEDRNGNRSVYTYDTVPFDALAVSDRLRTVTDAVGRRYVFTYGRPPEFNAEERLLTLEVPECGITVTFGYDSLGRLREVKRSTRVETYTYVDQEGDDGYNLASFTDGLGHTTQYRYMPVADVPGELAQMVRGTNISAVMKEIEFADGAVVQFGYDFSTANVRTYTDARDNVTTYTLNSHGNPIKAEEPLGRVTLTTWSTDEGKDNRVMTSETKNGETTLYEHDAKGNVVKETDPLGAVITSTWHQTFGGFLTRTDREGHTVRREYDTEGNLVAEYDAKDQAVIHTYDGEGRRLTTTDRNGNVRSFTYNAQGVLETMVEPSSAGLATTTFEYDIRGLLLSKTDPRGKKTTYTYDDLDRLVTEIDPKGARRTVAYDVGDNRSREVNKRGLIVEHEYDRRERLIKTTRLFDGAVKTFSYDDNGNMLTETDWLGRATTHVYDALNRDIETIDRDGKSSFTTYNYDDRILTLTDARGKVRSYTYDANGLQLTYRDPENGVTSNTYDAEGHVLTKTDAEGRTTVLVYDPRYLVEREINDYGHALVNEYDDNGNLITRTDREGRIWRFEYDERNQQVRMIDALLGESVLTYDLSGNVTEVRDPEGGESIRTFDDLDRQVSEINAEGLARVVTYDAESLPIETIDEAGLDRQSKFDVLGRLITSVDKMKAVTRREYDANSNVTKIIMPDERVVTMEYDRMDRRVRLTEGVGTPLARSFEFTYDAVGNQLTVKNARGFLVTAEHDGLNRVTKRIDALDGEWVTTYDKVGNIVAFRDPRGEVARAEYDRLDRIINTTDAENHVVTYEYDKVGNRTRVIDENGRETVAEYDDLNRVLETRRAGVRVNTYEYDGVGNLLTTRDARDNVVINEYDEMYRLVKVTHPDATFREMTYDSAGNLKTETDELGKTVVTKTYDKENRLLSTMDALGHKTRYTYDVVGRMIRVLKPRGNEMRSAYDLLGRLVEVRTAAGTTRFEYDAGDNMTAQVDANGQRSEFVYDPLNRRRRIVQKGTSGDLVTEVTYDPVGNVQTWTDAEGQRVDYTYDGNSRETLRTYPVATTALRAPRSIAQSFDNKGNLTQVIETKFDSDVGALVSEVTGMTYDTFDRLTDFTQRGQVATCIYDAAGNRTSTTFGSRTTLATFDNRNRLATVTAQGESAGTTYHYRANSSIERIAHPDFEVLYEHNDAGLPTRITNQIPGATPVVLSRYDYTYDTNNNRTHQLDTQSSMVQESTDYSYDFDDRLTGFTVAGGSSVVTTSYVLDAAGNRIREFVDNGSTVINRELTYDVFNHLTRVREAAGDITLTYDDNGSPLIKLDTRGAPVETEFYYDTRNQLVQVKKGPPGSEVSLGRYDYNYRGMRTRQEGSNRGDIEYFYDRDMLIEEHDLDSGGALVAHYRYGDRPLRMDTGSESFYYAHDVLGSTTNLVAAGGTLETSYRVDPWGGSRQVTGDTTTANRFTFTGKPYDEATGLHYFDTRYYDAQLGRFMTQDSYLGDPNHPITLNRYAYAGANPGAYIDPDGRSLLGFLYSGLAGAAASVTIGWASEKYINGKQELTLMDYAFSAEGMVDALTGFASGGLSWLGAAKHLRTGLVHVADAAVAVAGDSWKAREIRGEGYGLTDMATSALGPIAAKMVGAKAKEVAAPYLSAARNAFAPALASTFGKIGKAITARLTKEASTPPAALGLGKEAAKLEAESITKEMQRMLKKLDGYDNKMTGADMREVRESLISFAKKHKIIIHENQSSNYRVDGVAGKELSEIKINYKVTSDFDTVSAGARHELAHLMHMVHGRAILNASISSTAKDIGERFGERAAAMHRERASEMARKYLTEVLEPSSGSPQYRQYEKAVTYISSWTTWMTPSKATSEVWASNVGRLLGENVEMVTKGSANFSAGWDIYARAMANATMVMGDPLGNAVAQTKFGAFMVGSMGSAYALAGGSVTGAAGSLGDLLMPKPGSSPGLPSLSDAEGWGAGVSVPGR
jgi:RHS repeat-associated protein